MTKLLIVLTILFTTISISAQKSNAAIATQLKQLRADRTITITYDTGSDTTKLMVRADNFDYRESAKAGIQAMNFGMAVFYPGKSIVTPPDTFNLTFWVLTKKPKFAAAHNWSATLAKETLDLGDARYVSKPAEGMEYLNFKIARDDLAKFAAEPNVKIKLGTAAFTFTAEHIAIFNNLLAATDTQ